jgi:hypothetical protein
MFTLHKEISNREREWSRFERARDELQRKASLIHEGFFQETLTRENTIILKIKDKTGKRLRITTGISKQKLSKDLNTLMKQCE